MPRGPHYYRTLPWAAWGARRTWRAPCCFWPPIWRGTSPARCWWSMVGWSSDLRMRETPIEDDMSNVEEKVKDIIVEELGVEREKLTSEASFMEDLGADSLDTVELVMAFEKEFDIDIPDEDAEKLRTVGDAMNYLHEKIGK